MLNLMNPPDFYVDPFLRCLVFTLPPIILQKRNKKIPASIQLTGTFVFETRAENETRTRDPNLGKVMLYQLSYFRK